MSYRPILLMDQPRRSWLWQRGLPRWQCGRCKQINSVWLSYCDGGAPGYIGYCCLGCGLWLSYVNLMDYHEATECEEERQKGVVPVRRYER